MAVKLDFASLLLFVVQIAQLFALKEELNKNKIDNKNPIFGVQIVYLVFNIFNRNNRILDYVSILVDLVIMYVASELNMMLIVITAAISFIIKFIMIFTHRYEQFINNQYEQFTNEHYNTDLDKQGCGQKNCKGHYMNENYINEHYNTDLDKQGCGQNNCQENYIELNDQQKYELMVKQHNENQPQYELQRLKQQRNSTVDLGIEKLRAQVMQFTQENMQGDQLLDEQKQKQIIADVKAELLIKLQSLLKDSKQLIASANQLKAIKNQEETFSKMNQKYQ